MLQECDKCCGSGFGQQAAAQGPRFSHRDRASHKYPWLRLIRDTVLGCWCGLEMCPVSLEKDLARYPMQTCLVLISVLLGSSGVLTMVLVPATLILGAHKSRSIGAGCWQVEPTTQSSLLAHGRTA